MGNIWFLILAACVAGDVVFIDSQASNPTSDGSKLSPFKDIDTAVLVPSSDLYINFTQSETPKTYQMSKLGMHRTIDFHCARNHIKLVWILIVGQGVNVTFDECGITSDLALPEFVLIVVYGKVALTSSVISGMKMKSIGVYGELEATNSIFSNNFDSLLASNQRGWKMNVTDCVFVDNTSPLGSAFAILFSGNNTGSSQLEVRNSLFANNSAVMGGSVALFMENSDSTVPAGYNHSAHFWNCQFTNNTGYAFIAYVKHYTLDFEDSLFYFHDYVMVAIVYSGSISFQRAYIHACQFFLVSTYMRGFILLHDLWLDTILLGPAIGCVDYGSEMVGYFDIRNLTFTNTQRNVNKYRMATIMLLGMSGEIDGITVRNSSAVWSVGGDYAQGAYRVSNVDISDSSAEGGMGIVFYFSTAVVTNVTVRDSTVDTSGCICSFFANTSIANMKIQNVSSVFHIIGKYSNTMIVAYNSITKYAGVMIRLPELTSTPVIMVVTSRVELYDLRMQKLHGTLVMASFVSNVTVSNIEIEYANVANLIDISYKSTLKISEFTVRSGTASQQFLRLHTSNGVIDRIALGKMTLSAVISSILSDYSIANLALDNVIIDTLFPIQMRW